MTLSIGILMSFVFLFMGQYELILAWWIMLVLLLPSLFLVQRVRFVSIKAVVWFVLIAQAVTLPLFYLRAEHYRFQTHRPYDFTGLESLQVYLPLGLLLFTIVLLSYIFSKFKIKNKISKSIRNSTDNTGAIQILQDPTSASHQIIRSRRSNIFILAGIVAVIAIMIPVNAWMFKMGIGLTGIAPPQLPFKLSGILTYLAKYIVPFSLAFLYILSTRKSYFIVILFGLYSIFLGLTTVSRGAALLVMLAPLAFAMVDRRMGLMALSLILISLSLLVATVARNFIFIVDAGVSGADLSLGIFGTLTSVMNEVDWERFLLILPSIVARLSSFQNLFMSSQFDPMSVGGGWSIFIKQVDWRLIDLGHDAMHMEMLGYTVPRGFYMGLYGYWGPAMAAINQSYLFLLPFGTFAAFFLILQEWLLKNAMRIYCVKNIFFSIMIILLTLNFLVSQGSLVVNYLLVFLFFIVIMPRIKEAGVLLRSLGVSTR